MSDHNVYSPTTGQTITRPKEIALGLDPHYKSLADDAGAARYREWADVGLTRRTVDRRFGRAFHQAAKRAERIHFTLDGIDDVTDAIRRGRAGFSIGNMTNAELHHIVTNPERLTKTIFYRNGKIDNSIFNLLAQLGYHR